MASEPTYPPIFPDLTADWKVVRSLSDAINEAVDNAVDYLIDNWTGEVPHESNEEAWGVLTNELSERLYNLATKGQHP